jgi:hypothetical protein
MPAQKRETIQPNPDDKRFIRRDPRGQFTPDQADVGRSLGRDVRQQATRVAKKGEGDRGDQARPDGRR